MVGSITNRIDQFFFSKHFDREKKLKQLGHDILQARTADEFNRIALAGIISCFASVRASLFLLDEGKKAYILQSAVGWGKQSDKDRLARLDLGEPIVQYLKQDGRSVLTLREILDGIGLPIEQNKLGSFMQQLEAALTVRILADEHIQGLLILGNKESGLPYEAEDFDSLRILAENMSSVLEKIDLEKKRVIRDYNLLLQLKIKESQASIAAQVAHDIRSPLAALDSVIGTLAELPEENRSIIRSAISRIRDIANELLEKNKEPQAARSLMDGTGPLPPSVDKTGIYLLSALIDPLITEKRLQFRSKIGVEIYGNIDTESYGLFARIQPIEFKRVLSNLINNSVEALGEKGAATVSLVSDGDEIVVKVRDNGRGIPPDILSKLGRKGESHGKAGGTGLGLYHARACVESWGGTLKIESTVGKGTTVKLKLPQSAAPDWFVSELVLDPKNPVVVLDDDTSIHQIWQARLANIKGTDSGINLIHFSRPLELREWVNRNRDRARIACYLLDYELLGYKETGLELSEELGISERAILVTSRYEEPGILESCQKLNIRMIPKGLAGLVPIRLNEGNNSAASKRENWDAVLIDDDSLVQTTWKITASQIGKKFRGFASIDNFLADSDGIGRSTPVYIDVELGNGVRGDYESLKIAKIGFKNIYLATGHSAEKFPSLKHVRGVVGKSPPWKE